jgi:prevent-host-death family protein
MNNLRPPRNAYTDYNGCMMNEKVTVHVRELRDNLAFYLNQVSHGDEVTVTSHGKPIAKIVPTLSKKPRSALFGAMRGQITMAADFDRTPDDMIDAMEDLGE